MTKEQLIKELNRCPDPRAQVVYKNMEIDDTCSIGRVIIKQCKECISGHKYTIILD